MSIRQSRHMMHHSLLTKCLGVLFSHFPKKTKILLLLMTVLLLETVSAGAKTLKIVYFDQFEPFSWRENNKMKGLFIDVVNEAIGKRMGLPVLHEGYSWNRAQAMVRDGSADGMCTIITSERLQYAVSTTTPVVTLNFRIFTAANNPRMSQLKRVKTIQDLSGFKLIDILGSGWAIENLKGMNVYFAPSYFQVFSLLESGKYDAAIRNDRQYIF
jgi:polar amino acid transport system substrate-binding protein